MASSRPLERRVDIYDATVLLCLTQEQWQSASDRFEGLDPDSTEALGSVAITIDTEAHNKPYLTVWLDVAGHRGDKVRLVNSVAHEATHAAGMLLDHIGQTYDGDSEALAYLVGWLAAWIWEQLP